MNREKCGWLDCDSPPARPLKLCNHHAGLRSGHTHGNGRPKTYLTEDQRDQIRLRMSRLESPKAIAKDFGVTTRAVLYAMKAGKS